MSSSGAPASSSGTRRFVHKTVVITGASAGIGLAAARRFAAEGARLVLVARGGARLNQVAEGFRADGAEVLAIAGDIGDDETCTRILNEAVEHFGRLDVLVNNAALHHRGPFESIAASDLAHMVDVNLRSPVLMTRIAVPLMRQTGGGAIVQVASLAGCVPTPGSAVYSATKFGVRALSRALAIELADANITFSVVSPGPVDTGFIMDDLDSVTDLTLSQPMSTADEVAEAVVACAIDGKPERRLPASSGVLTTVAYVLPGLARVLKPVMERRGRKARARILKGR